MRPDAPWAPSNIEFIRRINGLDSIEEVFNVVFDASYLVLGLGDTGLSAARWVAGRGGHAALPHHTVDAIVTGAQVVSALQTLVSRSTDPLDGAVVSDKGLKLDAGSFVLQVGKRKFARVHLN